MHIKYNYIFIIIVFFITNRIHTQPIVDTLYSGRNSEINLSKSISSKLKIKLQNVEFYVSKSNQPNEWKSIVPSILFYNSEKRVKSNALLNYDALIYTIFTRRLSIPHELVFMEMFFENEKLAIECIRGLKKLEKAFDIYKYKEMVESKTEMVGQLEHYNCYYIRKGNVVYFIYNMIPDTRENPITAIMKEKLLEIID